MLRQKSDVDAMPYQSSLIDEEWKILEPLLPKLLPPKKQTRPSNWSKREILDGIRDQLKNGCNWQDLPKDLPPNCLLARAGSGAKLGQPLKLMNFLHGQVREQVKKAESLGCSFASPKPFQEKSQVDEVDDYRFPSSKKHL